jgi:hypothetical protein
MSKHVSRSSRIASLAARSDEPTRRAFLGHSALGLLGVGAMPLLTSMTGRSSSRGGGDDVPGLGVATAKSVIYLYMSGGMSHIDSFDPKPGAATMGPAEAIGTNVDGIQLSQYFPALGRQADKLAVIRSMWSNQGAHEQGRYFMHTSYALRGTIRHPSLGAWLTKVGGNRNPTLPGHVSVGGDALMASGGFLESSYYPLPIGDPAAGLQNSKRPPEVTVERFHRRMQRLAEMNESFEESFGGVKSVRAYTEMYEQAVALMESKDLAAFEIAKEPEEMRAAYGNNRFGQGCLLARRLVEHGVRFVEVVNGGWDTHVENFDEFDDKAPPVDRAIATLLADLDARGLLEETLVVVTTEFGRTPDITPGNNGRNHYPRAFSSLLAGGGIRGGQVWGQTDEEGREIVADKVTVPDFNATIAHACGLPLEHEFYSPSGRPFRVADKGRPVKELFA